MQDSLTALSWTSPNVLCLGLGSPCTSRDSRNQLAFLLHITERFHIKHGRVSIYDPVFTEEDVALLTELELCRLTDNQHGLYPVEGPTIVFMPHCEVDLYEDFLRANWTLERISNILLVANQLDDYVLANPSHRLNAKFPCISRLAPHLVSRPLPPSGFNPTAFNNSSVQFVRGAALSLSGDWLLPFPNQ